MTERVLTRRALLRAAWPLATFPVVALSSRSWRGAPTRVRGRREALRVAVLLPAGGDGGADIAALAHGVTLGAEEAARTASLFGLDIDIVTERSASTSDDGPALRLLSAKPAALVCSLDADQCGPIAALAARHDVLIANLGAAPERPLASPCLGRLVHLSPNAATLRRAREAFARRPGATQDGGATIAIWHHTLRRFGAEQLNERFRRRFATEMCSQAWVAWVAMKIVTESALRARTTSGPDVARHLLARGARFDGHKGEPLAFDASTGELRQPLYVVNGDVVAAELSTEDVHGVSR